MSYVAYNAIDPEQVFSLVEGFMLAQPSSTQADMIAYATADAPQGAGASPVLFPLALDEYMQAAGELGIVSAPATYESVRDWAQSGSNGALEVLRDKVRATELWKYTIDRYHWMLLTDELNLDVLTRLTHVTQARDAQPTSSDAEQHVFDALEQVVELLDQRKASLEFRILSLRDRLDQTELALGL